MTEKLYVKPVADAFDVEDDCTMAAVSQPDGDAAKFSSLDGVYDDSSSSISPFDTPSSSAESLSSGPF